MGLLLGYGVVKDVERAEKLFADMLSKKLPSPDPYTYYQMMRILVSEGRAERTLEVFEALKKTSLPRLPDCWCYAMDAAIQLEKIDYALELRREMKKKGTL